MRSMEAERMELRPHKVTVQVRSQERSGLHEGTFRSQAFLRISLYLVVFPGILKAC